MKNQSKILEKKTLKGYLLAFNLMVLLFMPHALVNGCAGGGDMDEYYSMFAPETSGQPGFKPFFFSFHSFYNSGSYDSEGEKESDNQSFLNMKEWKNYFNDKISIENLEKIIYTKTEVEISYDLEQAEKGIIPAEYLSIKEKALGFLRYLFVSKKIENIAYVYQEEGWDIKYKQVDTKIDNAIISELKSSYSNANDAFLKQRYAYQLIRTYFYSLQFENAINLYESSTELNKKTDYIHFMSLRYLYGAYYRVKNYSKANYYAAILFDAFPSARKEAFRFFHPQEEAEWQETLRWRRITRRKWHYGICLDTMPTQF